MARTIPTIRPVFDFFSGGAPVAAALRRLLRLALAGVALLRVAGLGVVLLIAALLRQVTCW